MNIAVILLILLVGSIATFFSTNKLARITAMIFSLASLPFSIGLLVKGTKVPYEELISLNKFFTPLFYLDGFALALIVLTTVLLPLIILTGTSKSYLRERYFYSLVLFMGFAVLGTFVSGNAILYYIFWELSLLPIILLVILWGHGKFVEKRRSVMTFFIQTLVGSLIMLVAILYLYTKTGSFQITSFYQLSLNIREQILIFLAFFLAYAIKAPIFPFHTWQANLYMRAPAIGTMMLAALMSKMALYSIIRWQLPIAPEAAYILRPLMLFLCIISVLYGIIIALKQDNLKRFFAYVSMSHIGVIAAGIYSLTWLGLQGAMLLIFAHALLVVGLFYIVDIIKIRTNKNSIAELGGLRQCAGKFSFAFLLLVLAAVSFPLTFNFVGELDILLGLYSFSNNFVYVIVIGLSLILGAYALLRMYQLVVLGPKKENDFNDLNFKEGLILTILLALIIFFGFFSEPLINILKGTITEVIYYLSI